VLSAVEYRKKQAQLLNEYEEKVRKWLKDNGEQEIELINPTMNSTENFYKKR